MILVIDNYDSFTQNLVHLIGKHTEAVQVVRNDEITVDKIRELAPRGILISPGPGRPEDAGITVDVIETLGPTTPILGVCLGHQAIGYAAGADVIQAGELMHGKTSTVRHDGRTIFQGLDQDFEATRYHSLMLDEETLPPELEVSARTTDQSTIMGVRHRAYSIEGVQFHPESIMTSLGKQLVKNWLDSLPEQSMEDLNQEEHPAETVVFSPNNNPFLQRAHQAAEKAQQATKKGDSAASDADHDASDRDSTDRDTPDGARSEGSTSGSSDGQAGAEASSADDSDDRSTDEEGDEAPPTRDFEPGRALHEYYDEDDDET